MTDFNEFQLKIDEVQKKSLAGLSTSDREILQKVLEIESETFGLRTPDVLKFLQDVVQQVKE